MKIFSKIALGLLFSFNIGLSALATELPARVVEYLKTEYPKATVRFDGLIELPDGTQYLPVLPLSYENIDTPQKIVQTIPANLTLKSKPDLVLFANNLSLLKVIKNPDGTLTLLDSNEIPVQVKLGLLPQDLVVPEKLIIPRELKIILGDLKISVRGEDRYEIPVSANQKANSVSNIANKTNNKSPELKNLVNKTIYATSFQSNLVNIINPETGNVINAVKLTSVPSDIAITDDKRYVLVSSFASDKISVIDNISKTYVKDIEVGKQPVSITIANGQDLAYIANRLSSTISVIDLKNMNLLKEISVTGNPINLIVSEDSENLFYNDSFSGKVYKLNLSTKTAKPEMLIQVNNISKMLQKDGYLFVLSRTGNKMTVFDLNANKKLKEIEVGSKPVDIKYANEKLYVLAAGSSELSVVDIPTLEIAGKIELKRGSFAKSITIFDSESKAIVSTVDSYEISIVDLLKGSVITTLPVGSSVNSLVICE